MGQLVIKHGIPAADLLCWTDLETTGLAASKEVPLELGMVLTDAWGNEIDSVKWLIWETENKAFQQAVLRCQVGEDQFVNEMHTKSGLWTDLRTSPHHSRRGVEKRAIMWLQARGVEERMTPMCGSSIGSLDRPFALSHLPALNEFLSYRNIDISSIKEICKRVNPELFENLRPIIGTKADSTHRVLDDCRASIREYQTYLDEFLIVRDD